MFVDFRKLGKMDNKRFKNKKNQPCIIFSLPRTYLTTFISNLLPLVL